MRMKLPWASWAAYRYGVAMTYRTTPTADELRGLSTPELGLVILKSGMTDLHLPNLLVEHRQAHDRTGSTTPST